MAHEITLQPATKELCRKFYQEFENDPAIYPDLAWYKDYVYDEAEVDRRFEEQQTPERMVFMAMLGERPIGEVTLKHIDREKRECSLGIHLQNDTVKGLGYGTRAERLALRYAFEELDMLAVNAGVIHRNERSRHVLEKVGFRQVGKDETFLHYRCERDADPWQN